MKDVQAVKAANLPEDEAAGGGMILPDSRVEVDFLKDHLARYDFAAGFVKGKKVLDIACGSGYGSNYLLKRGAAIVIGGDISTEALAAAQRIYGNSGVKFAIIDATKLPFEDGSLEVVVSMETIEHLEQYEEYMRECKRVLENGGIFICSTPNMAGIMELQPFHVHEFYMEEFKELFEKHFGQVELYGQGYWHQFEKTNISLRWRVEKVITPMLKVIPGLFQLARYLDRKLIKRWHLTSLSELDKLEKVLGEEDKLFLLPSGSRIPKTMVAVARKQA